MGPHLGPCNRKKQFPGGASARASKLRSECRAEKRLALFILCCVRPQIYIIRTDVQSEASLVHLVIVEPRGRSESRLAMCDNLTIISQRVGADAVRDPGEVIEDRSYFMFTRSNASGRVLHRGS
jgi:hypothetical protein